MEQQTATPDYQAYDRVWQRVAPQLDPYPDARAENERLLTLPGAQRDPCCMGSGAQAELEVLQGFIREELAESRALQGLARCAPDARARRSLHELAALTLAHVRTLQAAHYLSTGETYRITLCCAPEQTKDRCAALRARYHGAACAGFNYARAAEETEDVCLRRIFSALSEESYASAAALRRLLERAL